jgi:signal transduction histidine kinase
MTLLIPALWMGAGIAFFTAIQSSIIASLRHRPRLHLSFAAVCANIGGVLVSTAMYYRAITVDQAAGALRWQLTFIFLVMPFIYAFVGLSTGLKRLRALPLISLFFLVCIALNLTSPYSFRFESLTMLPRLRLPWGEWLPQFHGRVAPIARVAALVIAALNAWTFMRARAQYRRGEQKAAIFLTIYAVAQSAAHVWSVLIDRGTVRGFYVGGFAFLAIALLMSINFAIDIRDRNRTIRVAATDWQQTFDSLRTPIALIDANGTVLRSNRAARDLTGSDLLTHLPDVEPWRSALDLIAQIGDGGVVSAELTSPSGRSWELTVTRFATTSGGETRCIIALWDISNLVSLQESLRKRERISAMGALVAGVAHEVRNPLFGISATIDAYDQELASGELRPFAATLRGEVQRLTTLMRELLDFGKPSALQLRVEQIGVVVREAIAPYVARGINVMAEISESLPPVVLDRARLRQVFVNLIENALQHSPDGSPISISATTIEQAGRPWIECHVDDRGCGFGAAETERIFEPFYSRREGGTGLGLSIVQRIVEEHAGKVWACNRPAGGASVRVRLPIPEV